jgi:hypothetical protein
MHLPGINQDNAPSIGHMPVLPVHKLFRALLDGSYYIAFVRMGSERVRDIPGMQQFQIVQRRITPEFDLLVGVHEPQLSLRGSDRETVLLSSQPGRNDHVVEITISGQSDARQYSPQTYAERSSMG